MCEIHVLGHLVCENLLKARLLSMVRACPSIDISYTCLGHVLHQKKRL